jgi:hypothetical protein
MLGWAAVEGLDWSRLLHAYGPATDTPEHLRELTGDDPAKQAAALDHLYGSVNHQYSCYPATSSAVRVVGGLLEHPFLRRAIAPGRESVLAGVLDFFDSVAYGGSMAAEGGAPTTATLAWADLDVSSGDVEGYFDALAEGTGEVFDDSPVGRLWNWSSADLFAALAEVVDAVTPYMNDRDPGVALRAVYVLTRIGRAPGPSDRASELVDLFAERAADARGRDERAALVVGIGELGGDTSPWLGDADVAIRACSAVYLPTDPAAAQPLLAVLSQPEDLKSWFTEPPWRHYGVRERLIEGLLERDLTFAETLPAAVAIAETADPYVPDQDWGLLLRKAFPDVVFEPGVQPPPPGPLDDAQRAYLRALVNNDEIWEKTNGSARLARMRVGIPHTQAEVLALLGESPRRRLWWRRK